jgi:hypothetical protein
MKNHSHWMAAAILFAVFARVLPVSAATTMNIWPDDSVELKGVEEKHIPKMFLYPGKEAE